jgi:hypothetical protein
MNPNIERSGSFVCKKWTLFSVCLISIIWCIVLAALEPKLVHIYAQNFNSQEYTDEVKVLDFFKFINQSNMKNEKKQLFLSSEFNQRPNNGVCGHQYFIQFVGPFGCL